MIDRSYEHRQIYRPKLTGVSEISSAGKSVDLSASGAAA